MTLQNTHCTWRSMFYQVTSQHIYYVPLTERRHCIDLQKGETQMLQKSNTHYHIQFGLQWQIQRTLYQGRIQASGPKFSHILFFFPLHFLVHYGRKKKHKPLLKHRPGLLNMHTHTGKPPRLVQFDGVRKDSGFRVCWIDSRAENRCEGAADRLRDGGESWYQSRADNFVSFCQRERLTSVTSKFTYCTVCSVLYRRHLINTYGNCHESEILYFLSTSE